MECPICYVEITTDVNYTITSCKHTFCMKCFISSVLQNNLCPCCRSELYEKEEEDEQEEDTETYNETEYTVSEINYEELRYFQETEEPIASMEEIVRNFEDKGYTMLDLMQLVIPQRQYRDTNENTYDTIAQELNASIEQADFDAKISHYERQIMEKEDYTANI